MFPTQRVLPKKEEKPECKIRIKRDRRGKIIGMQREGKCTKEDMMAFAEKNEIELEEE